MIMNFDAWEQMDTHHRLFPIHILYVQSTANGSQLTLYLVLTILFSIIATC